MTPMGHEWIPAILLAVLAAGIDVRRGIIPNRLTLSGFLGGLAWHLTLGGGVLFALAGAATASLLFLVPHLRGGIGGGDIKLFAAVGAFLGPLSGLRVAIGAAAAGGVLAAAFLLARAMANRRDKATPKDPGGRNVRREAGVRPEGRTRNWGAIPYGPAIAVGTALSIMAA
ncbi:MAG: prepilin peptidase [Nitrospinota bacterium]